MSDDDEMGPWAVIIRIACRCILEKELRDRDLVADHYELIRDANLHETAVDLPT